MDINSRHRNVESRDGGIGLGEAMTGVELQERYWLGVTNEMLIRMNKMLSKEDLTFVLSAHLLHYICESKEIDYRNP